MPRRLLRDVPMDTIYDQIGQVRKQLLDEADTVVAAACGKLEVQVAVPVAATTVGANALASVMRTGSGDADDTAPLRQFYLKEMRPFVESPSRTHALANEMSARAMFGKLRPLLQPSLEPAIADGILHSWLIVHVPLSFALMVLAVVHIVMALRF
jgi:hypothetical protein